MQQLTDLCIMHFISFALAFSVNFMYMGNVLHKNGFKYVRLMYVESHLFWQHSIRVCYTHSLSASATVHLYWAVEKRQISANCRTCNEITTSTETCYVRMPHLTHSLPMPPYNALMIEIFLLFSIRCHMLQCVKVCWYSTYILKADTTFNFINKKAKKPERLVSAPHLPTM